MIQLSKIFTISNFISFFRLLLAVPFWIMLDNIQYGGMRYYIFGLCLFAAGTDILDGYLARKFKQVTEFGKIIDPLADKIAVGVIIVKLYVMEEIPLYYFLAIIGRDLIIFIGGILLSLKIGKVLPSNALGKFTVIIIGIVILLIVLHVNRKEILFLAFYGLSIILIISSLIAYSVRAFEFFKKKNYESV
ncbi:MAG TPA: CDP-alcohol phosphatidyltransferase family protein [Ignavibacteriaceae bacterium]|nr:CDP-alcohol phosphatidyltransferase family protein [Ignavibacteriaceae bacterium]